MLVESSALILKKWMPVIINLENVKFIEKGVKLSKKIINIWSGLSTFLILTKLMKELSFIHKNFNKLSRKIIKITKETNDSMNFVWMSETPDTEYPSNQNHRLTPTPKLRKELCVWQLLLDDSSPLYYYWLFKVTRPCLNLPINNFNYSHSSTPSDLLWLSNSKVKKILWGRGF